jgi:Flp pilus assembly protein TadG
MNSSSVRDVSLLPLNAHKLSYREDFGGCPMLRLLKKFSHARDGQFALIAALTFPMMFVGVAAAVDLSNSMRIRSELQNANDSAVVYAARHYQITKEIPSDADVAQFLGSNTSYSATSVKLKFDEKKSEFTLTSKVETKPMLMNFFGKNSGSHDVISKAELGVGGILEFALALDTTESMKDENRMTGLKSAATAFINMLMDVKDRGANVRGAIVPFERYVNVGVSRRNQPWMDVEPDSDTRKWDNVCTDKTEQTGCSRWENSCWPAQTINHPAQKGSCWFQDGYQRCNPDKPAWTQYIAAGCSNSCVQPITRVVTTCTKKVVSGSLRQWRGCVGSRTYPLNVKEAFDAKKFPGLMNVSCAQELMPLSDDRKTLIDKINALSPSGNTYIPEGIMWGTRMLTPEQPFTEGAAAPAASATYEMRKALIIMTDGKNSMRAHASNGTHNNLPDFNNTTVPDGITLEACTEAKRVGLEVYTVSFGNEVPDSIKTLLSQCASKPDLNFHAVNNAALVDAFSEIADELLSIRLSQ